MANSEHLELARQGREAWNRWRRRNPDLPADFARLDFTAPGNDKISFAGFELGPKADFSHCIFGGADHRAVAAQDVNPYAPEIAHYLTGGAWFYGARFGPGANFASCTFKGAAVFQRAVFGREANFTSAAFLDEANFVGAQFGAGASFAEAAFAKLMQFERARFAGAASFAGGAGAAAPADTLPYLTFRQARFAGAASFAHRRFLDRADFAYAAFDVPPNFAGSDGTERLDFQGTRFRLREGLIPGWTTRAGTVAAIRHLRGIARIAGAHQAERDLLVLERKAERGTAWKNARDAVWADPLRKLGLYGRALAATVLLFLYGLFSDCGRGLLRPLVWLALVNAAAYLAYRGYAKPSTTAVGRTARGAWGWIKSQFVSAPPSATTSSLSADQQRSLFEFWWSGAVPGSVTRSAYEKSVLALFGADGVPPPVYVLQFGQTALNLLLVLLLALAVRNHFRGATPT
jgi:uncharacterized protein YjbI with pentapeptide repeats